MITSSARPTLGVTESLVRELREFQQRVVFVGYDAEQAEMVDSRAACHIIIGLLLGHLTWYGTLSLKSFARERNLFRLRVPYQVP